MIRSLTWRLTLPIVLVGVLMLLLGVGAAFYVHREYGRRADFITMQIEGERILQTLTFTARDVRTTLGRFLVDGDRENIDLTLKLEPTVRTLVDQAAGYVQTPEGEALIRQLHAGTDIVFNRIREMRDLSVPDLRKQIIDFNNGVVTPQLYEPALKYLDLKHERVQHALEQYEDFSEMLILSMLLLALCGATAGVLWGVAVARGVGRSLVQMSVPIRSAAGRLNEVGPLTVQTHWRFDELPAVVDRMAEQIGDVIEQMRQTRRRAERSEQLAAAGQLAAGMAHELRNPLTSMKLLVQSAQMRSSAGEALGPRDLSILGEEIERLERVVSTILDYARPPRMHPAAVDLKSVIGRTVELLADRYRLRGVDLVAELPEKPCIVQGDSGQLRQVWLNLLLNSLDASITGQTVTIRLTPDAPAGAHSGGGKQHLIEVLDEGSGLPKDLGGDIFEPFITSKETGLGLGLAISRRIIEEHGGRIDAADRAGGGAVMRVYLPVESPLADEPETIEPEMAAHSSS